MDVFYLSSELWQVIVCVCVCVCVCQVRVCACMCDSFFWRVYSTRLGSVCLCVGLFCYSKPLCFVGYFEPPRTWAKRSICETSSSFKKVMKTGGFCMNRVNRFISRNEVLKTLGFRNFHVETPTAEK